MPDKKVVPVRFYFETDKDLIEWLSSLKAGEGNHTIKTMLRAGIAAIQNGNSYLTHPTYSASLETSDPESLQAALEDLLPRIREVVDASLASANFTPLSKETASQDESIASPNLLKGHVLGEDEDE